jgi:hypothetical protein
VYEEKPKRYNDVRETEEDEDNEGDNYSNIEEAVKRFGRKLLGEITSPYLTPYLYIDVI